MRVFCVLVYVSVLLLGMVVMTGGVRKRIKAMRINSRLECHVR